MERKQELEWSEAQKIVISRDLVAAAKQQLQFLAVVDRNRHLYDSPALYKAINWYKYCWLPLLAKHAESQVSEGPLVVPLDCEWIWHCHRLNPVRCVTDYASLYRRILDNKNVVSSTQRTCKTKTEEIWNILHPHEPYELNTKAPSIRKMQLQKAPSMLVSAVRRQIPLCCQVFRSYVNDNLLLKGAVAGYKDSDRTKGQKLDVGFSEITKQWEETFGTRLVLIVAVKDLLVGHKGSLFVSFSKERPDLFFNTRRRINISSESEEMVSGFQCEPTGHMLFELISYSSSILSISKTPILLKISTITLEDLLSPVSKLQVEKWFELMANSAVVGSKPILRIALFDYCDFFVICTAHGSVDGSEPKLGSCNSASKFFYLFDVHHKEFMVAERRNNCLPEKKQKELMENDSKEPIDKCKEEGKRGNQFTASVKRSLRKAMKL
ncbi:Hypothetical predicted protein [Prunus dulcis]|uniref:GRDP C2 domain-containing protein n=1 Tax=Prunus dulcis TaxID=3755 RepID=A0A5E4EX36_PRUDU|nr:Hypothetical predicted protein [Prunus dulcis]